MTSHNELRGKRVLITGSTGFIGSHLTHRLVQEGSLVTAFVRHTSDRNSLRDLLSSIDLREVDIRTFGAVNAEIDRIRPEFVFHLGAEGVKNPFLPHNLALRTNLDGTINIVRASAAAGAHRVIQTGTSHEYGDLASEHKLDPISPYAASKAAAWAFCRMYFRTMGWPIVSLRLFQVYGPGQNGTLVPSAIAAASKNEVFPTTPGEQVRDWIFIDDVIDAYLHAATAPGIEGETFDIGTGIGTAVKDVADLIFHHFKSDSLKVGALPYRPGEVWEQVAQTDSANNKLGWKPTISLSEGIARTISVTMEPEVNRSLPSMAYADGIGTGVETESAAEKLRAEILDKVTEYYRIVHEPTRWESGTNRVQYAGRVFDDQEMRNAAESVLDFWLTAGRFATNFEEALGGYLGIREVIPVNSGSSANLVAISTLCSKQLHQRPLQPGDEVITPAVTFPTTLAPILQNRLVPVLVDSQMGNYNIDVQQLEAALSPKTRAIFAPHTLGNPIEMDILLDFAKVHDLWVVEDNCDALGSTYDGRMTGTMGHLGTSSFYPAHHITLGEGGAVYTNSRRLAKLARTIRDWGRDCWCGYDNPVNGKCGRRFDWSVEEDDSICYDHRYFFTEIGYNLKLTDPQAAIGVAQIEKLPDFIAARKRNFRMLFEGLKPLEEYFLLPTWSQKADPSWFAFPITVRHGAPFGRDSLQRYLEEHRIETRLLFAGNIRRQPGYQDANMRVIGELPIANEVMESTFFVGVYPGLGDMQINYMLETFYDFVRAQNVVVT